MSRDETAMLAIGVAFQREYDDLALSGIDDPILRNTGLCILESFVLKISFAILASLAHNFYCQVRSFRLIVTISKSLLFQADHIGIAKATESKSHRHWSEIDAPESPTDDVALLPLVHIVHNFLMEWSGHRQDLQKAITQFHQSVRV